MVVRSLFTLGAMFLAGTNAQEFLEETLDEADFDVRQLANHAGTSTDSASTAPAVKTNVKSTGTITGIKFADDAAIAAFATSATGTTMKTSICTQAKGTAESCTVPVLKATKARRLSDSDGRRLTAVDAVIAYEIVLTYADKAKADKAKADNTDKTNADAGSLAEAIATAVSTVVQADANLDGTPTVPAPALEVAAAPVASSSSGASQVGPSALLSLCFVALAALKF